MTPAMTRSLFHPPFAAARKRLRSRERFPDVAIHREGMRDRNSLAIAVDVVGRTKPPDIHVAVGDLERANGELHCPVDSKLVLLEGVGEARRALRRLC